MRKQRIGDQTAALAGARVAWSRAVRVYREAGGPIKHENINSVFVLNSSTSGAMLTNEDMVEKVEGAMTNIQKKTHGAMYQLVRNTRWKVDLIGRGMWVW